MSQPVAMRDMAEVHAQIDLCKEQQMKGSSLTPGMTYEDGVAAALEWVTLQIDEVPVESDD